jgi:MurNAc alpha-1-phosphate uridylyltransferase
MILAAGFGTRLQPYTLTMPKPLVSVGEKPILDHILDHLVDHGVTQTTINTHYLAKQIHRYITTRTAPDILISHEPEILDTGGGVKKALHHFGNAPFYVINGDSFWLDAPNAKTTLQALDEAWNPEMMDILILLQPVHTMQLTKGSGDYNILPDGRAKRSLDKTGTHMFTSIRINHPRIFENTPSSPFSYLKCLDDAQAKGRLYGATFAGEWHHISTAKDLKAVENHLAANPQNAATNQEA